MVAHRTMLKMRKKSVLYFVFCSTILWCGAQCRSFSDSKTNSINSDELKSILAKDDVFLADDDVTEKTACNEKPDVCPPTTLCKLKDDNAYFCDCLPGHKLPDGAFKENNTEACISPCSSNPCQNGGTCTVDKSKSKNFRCTCPTFYSGVTCEKKTCTKDTCKNGGVCKTTEDGCNCPESHDGLTCDKIKWCENNVCEASDEADCKYNLAKKFGYCSCKKSNFFDYSDKKCKNVSTCLNGCPTNEVCNFENGNCTCKPGYDRNNKQKCVKSDLCESDTCNGIPGSSCSESKEMVKCLCNTTHYYGKNQCKDATCFLKKYRKGCKDTCPAGLERKNGECKVTEGTCDKKCGDYGWCYLEDDKKKCACIEEVAELSEDEEKCVLKDIVCPDGIKLKSNNVSCNCKGKFKQAENGVTCERRVCADKDVQEECDKLNAVCHDEWENGNGFQCKCRDGYVPDATGVCIDKCSTLKNKLLCSVNRTQCFLDEAGKPNCRRPPGAIDIDKSSFLIQNVPVRIAKYLLGSKLDIVSLTSDIIKAMKHTFQNLKFAHLYTYRQLGDTVMCTVWLQFTKVSKWDYRRLEMQTVSLTPADTSVLPPNLILKKSFINKVNETEVKLCSELTEDPFCGGAKCDNNKCDCPKGYRVVDSSIREVNKKYIFKCEDINECREGSHSCPKESTECENTDGDFYCRCLPKYKLKENNAETQNKEACIGLCDSPNPCLNGGECKIHEKTLTIDCKCTPGMSGAFCEEKDLNFAGQAKKTVVVGAVLGSILGVVVIVIILYIIRQKKKSAYTEDFTPCPQRPDNAAEMIERRPVRGVTNRAYQ